MVCVTINTKTQWSMENSKNKNPYLLYIFKPKSNLYTALLYRRHENGLIDCD